MDFKIIEMHFINVYGTHENQTSGRGSIRYQVLALRPTPYVFKLNAEGKKMTTYLSTPRWCVLAPSFVAMTSLAASLLLAPTLAANAQQQAEQEEEYIEEIITTGTAGGAEIRVVHGGRRRCRPSILARPTPHDADVLERHQPLPHHGLEP